MTRKIEARRYSQAVLQIAMVQDRLDAWSTDLLQVAEVLGDATVAAWLDDPRVAFDDKMKVLSGQMSDVNPMALNLVKLLVTKGKASVMPDIAREYQRLLDSYRGIEHAEVTTAVPLDEADIGKLAGRLGAMVGKKVVVKPVVDPGVIGGIVARIDGKLLDASTRSKLEALRRDLAGGGKG